MSWQGTVTAIPTQLMPLLNPHLGSAAMKLTLSQLMLTPALSAPVMWTRAPSSALPATVPGLPLPASRYGITPPFPGMRPCYAHHPSSTPLDSDADRWHSGRSSWLTRNGKQISAEEMKNLADIARGETAAVDKAHAEGIHVAGERFVVTRIDDGNIYARQGRTGIAVSTSKQAILVAHHGEAQQAGNTTQTVEALKDYLVGQGY
ncbi:hypothetical protein N8I77_000431 [Diaporthe amygdali]|uniref:Profilin n=1 Tax=Phomopsis amygdali TaxID=1214568 RepID=A0AAD9SPZ4_PHOAM|nr:hypothetical protein N8I77_000431 [Diaporthe amygdali]